jgi:hypothetical protein
MEGSGERVIRLGVIVMMVDLHRLRRWRLDHPKRTGLDHKAERKVIVGGLESNLGFNQ